MFARAIEIMDRSPLLLHPDTPVKQAAGALLRCHVDGACVVDDGHLVGVVTVMDLIFQERLAPAPGHFLTPSARRTLAKVTGRRVSEIMSPAPTTVEPSADLTQLATLMVDKHFTLLPVVHEDRLVGVVDKWAVLNIAAGEGVADEPSHG